MIVRPGDGVLHLITQPDHAALARRLMERCVLLAREDRRDAILLAIAEHDNGWRELDEAPTIDAQGHVVDFISASPRPKQAVWPRGVARLAYHPYAAALVANHAVFVYDRFRSDPEWATFFSEMEALRDAHLAASGCSREELLADYVYVRIGDLISLTFCTGWSDEQRHAGWTVQRDNNRVAVSPAVFDASEIAFEIAARELPAAPFSSGEAFRAALAAAEGVTLQGTLLSRP